MSDERIFLGMPHSGTVHPRAGRAFWAVPSRDLGSVKQFPCNGSLLASVFNAIWCEALEARDRGEVTHFAMLHSDVVPEDFWIDALLDEYRRTGPAVLSVVVPIKDGRGVTSTAIDDPGDAWDPLFRLTLNEVYRLPETFGASDLGYADHALLVNTGCWVCDLRQDWCDSHHFEIRDGIRDRDGRRVAVVQPEDWLMSRWLHRRGLSVLATRKVKVEHVGPIGYSNSAPWGAWKRDERNAHKVKGKNHAHAAV